jgi:tetratricopeptide (TPR) repeat protein
MKPAVRVLICCLLVTAIAGGSPAWAQDKTWISFMYQGKKALDKRDFITAETNLLKIIELSKNTDIPSEHLAHVNSMLGEVYLGKRDYSTADQYFGYALHYLGDEHSARAADVLQKQAESYIMQRKYVDADPPLRRALSIYRRLGSRLDRRGLMSCLQNLSLVTSEEGNFEESEKYYKEWSRLTGGRYKSSRKVDRSQRRFDQAIRLLGRNETEAAAAVLKELSADPTVKPNLKTQALDKLAEYFEKRENYDQASALRQQLLKIEESIHDPNSPKLIWPIQRLANDYNKQKQFGEAENLYKRALAIAESKEGMAFGSLLGITFELGRFYEDTDRLADAEQLYKRSREKLISTNDSEALLFNVAHVYAKQKRYDEAVAIYKNLLENELKSAGPESGNLTTTLFFIGNTLTDQGKHAEAEPYFKRALDIRERISNEFGRMLHSKDSTMVAINMETLADCYEAQGKFNDARFLWEKILEIDRKERGSDSAVIAKDLASIGNLYEKTSQLEEAEKHLKKALQIFDRSNDKKPEDRQQYVKDYARVLRALQRDKEADDLEQSK